MSMIIGFAFMYLSILLAAFYIGWRINMVIEQLQALRRTTGEGLGHKNYEYHNNYARNVAVYKPFYDINPWAHE